MNSHAPMMTAAARPFSWFQMAMAASLRCSGVRCGAEELPRSIISFCADELACCRPSCGVQSHQTMAKKMVQDVENMWSAKKRCAK